MSKIEINLEKLYYGFPVFLIGYKDNKYEYNFTTLTSSYTLGEMVVVGISKFGNAIKQLKSSGCFTINIPDKSLMREIEIGGCNSGQDKFKLASNLKYYKSSKIDAPIIDNCILNIECEIVEVIESEEFKDYANIIAKIKGRIIDEDIQKNGAVERNALNPVIYMGDEFMRSYRYLSDEIHDLGSFSFTKKA